MRKAALRYRSLLVTPGVRGIFAFSLVGRLPIGMSTLLFVLVVHAGTGSYALAGLAAAANACATALCGPLLGRLSDRGHAALILTLSGIAQAASLVGLVVALKTGLDGVPVVAIGAITGAVNPPISAVTRTVLPRLAPDEPTRMTAFALDALLVELTYVIGPACVGVVAAVWDGYTATLLAAVFNAVGAFGLAAARSVRHGYPRSARTAVPAGTQSRWHRLIGPLSVPGLRIVLAASILQAAGFGVLEVAIPAYTTARGAPQLGGLLFAIWSVGSIVGGLWYGGRDFRATLGRQYLVLMALNVAGFAAILLAGGPYTLMVMLFFAGLVIAPTTTVESALVGGLVRPETTTEAFTWSGTAIYLGFAIGSGLSAVALSSELGHSSALTSATLLAVGMAALGTLLIALGRRSLRLPEPVPEALAATGELTVSSVKSR
jgi:MFS family permease